jgi:hypothetical protein
MHARPGLAQFCRIRPRHAIASVPRLVARRSLKPQLNQIRAWVRQGRTDAWIAHQLEVTVRDIEGFKREHGLAPEGEEPEPFTDDLDLRAEDDALIAAELDAEPDDDDEDDDGIEGAEGNGLSEGGEGGDRPRRRRGRRGGRGRRRRKALEGTFDHGDEGYGLWLDPSVQEDSVYAEHWAGHRPVTVSIEADRIVIRRAGEGGEDAENGTEEAAPDSLDPDEFAA